MGCHSYHETPETWQCRAQGPGGDGGQVLPVVDRLRKGEHRQSPREGQAVVGDAETGPS